MFQGKRTLVAQCQCIANITKNKRSLLSDTVCLHVIAYQTLKQLASVLLTLCEATVCLVASGEICMLSVSMHQMSIMRQQLFPSENFVSLT